MEMSGECHICVPTQDLIHHNLVSSHSAAALCAGVAHCATMTESNPKTSVTTPLEVIVHPLVLLSVVDHYNRMAKDTKGVCSLLLIVVNCPLFLCPIPQRVVGVLLGEVDKQGRVDVLNSYAVPFDEVMSIITTIDHV